jgi:hypothetical protein
MLISMEDAFFCLEDDPESEFVNVKEPRNRLKGIDPPANVCSLTGGYTKQGSLTVYRFGFWLAESIPWN